jgi:lipopolysaccharide/colanic/teichoic acid biosynthesis glycosyltransferase
MRQIESAVQYDQSMIEEAAAASDDRKGHDLAKSGFDFTVALLLLPILLPIIAVLYVLTRLDGGPGFFGHERVCRNGRRFKCWKIRTMVPDAQAVLRRHLAENPEAAAEWARDFKLTDDPRITRLGNFLRRTSLDELPQIWNVLRGDMSFVGPRPVTPDELPKYRGYEWCYLSLKPGITGLWQVSGRNDVDYDTRVRMDMTYCTERSLPRDVGIMFRTVGAVLGSTGR